MSQPNVRANRTSGLVLILAITLAGSVSASAQALTTLANFDPTDGSGPVGSLIADFQGDLFGTTDNGGADGLGTVFELAKTSTGYATTPTALVSFNGPNGKHPEGSLVADAQGNLFGTTENGGASGLGTVFEIAKTSTGYATTPTTLVSFNGTNGAYPLCGLIADAQGNLFGTTNGGGASGVPGYGTVFELAKTSTGYATTPTTLVSFNGTNGGQPVAGLIADSEGNLFGTTAFGGADGDGTVFEIAKTSTGYATTPTTLVGFDEANGADPFAGLIADGQGNLIGTTEAGGASDDGTVFEIVKTSTGYATTPTTLVSFDGTNGADPFAGVIADAQGNLFGTTYFGGASGRGTVFEIAKTSAGYATTPITLIGFDGTNGADPYAGVIADAQGNLFGTTFYSGSFGSGTVFQVSASGFLPPQQFVGTPGAANCHGTTISCLAQAYGGLAHAASSLSFDSVKALRDFVTSYCGN